MGPREGFNLVDVQHGFWRTTFNSKGSTGVAEALWASIDVLIQHVSCLE